MIISNVTTNLPTVGANNPGPETNWTNPSRITADDGSNATVAFSSGGEQSNYIVGSSFGFSIPTDAIVDGISVFVDGSLFSSFGIIGLSTGGTKDVGSLSGTYGGSTDLWGDTVITPAEINSGFEVRVFLMDISGGDGTGTIDYISATVYWHIEIEEVPSDVPTRVDYKVFSREGVFLGLLPGVTCPLTFTQDLNSAGSTMEVTCGADIGNLVEIGILLTEDDEPILTELDETILTETTNFKVVQGNSDIEAMFKNSNRIEAVLYNYWHVHGKVIFKGQVNRVSFQYGGEGQAVKLRVFSDGYDMSNYIARGYPFAYTTDVSQTSQNGYVTVSTGHFGNYERYGQTFVTGSVTNIGAISLLLEGTATVTVWLYNDPGHERSLIGTSTVNVSNPSAAVTQFEFPQLLNATASTQYFFTVSVMLDHSIRLYRHSSSATYANGSMYYAFYSGGSGGGGFAEVTGDLYFITKAGLPTTTTTYTSQDPVSGMMSNILTDYNNRGGYITERSFLPAGYNLTYTFNVANIYDVMRKVLEMSPTNYYSYIDLGTAEMDIDVVSSTADFVVTIGRDIHQVEISLSIEQVKNYLLFTGGDTGGGVNLYKDYQDTESTAYYGLRTQPQTDNRVILTATADAIGSSFITENSNEIQETRVTILDKYIDTTLLTPGKTIGFRNAGSFVDDLVLQIVSRDYNPLATTLTLGRLPISMSAEMHNIYVGLLNEQTVDNPSAPS